MQLRRLVPVSAFAVSALAWLPLGMTAFAVMRGIGVLPIVADWRLALWQLALLAAGGLPLMLACRKLWRDGYGFLAVASFALLAPLTVGAATVGGILGPVAVIAYAVVLSSPAWLLHVLIARRRRRPRRKLSRRNGD